MYFMMMDMVGWDCLICILLGWIWGFGYALYVFYDDGYGGVGMPGLCVVR